MKLVVKLLLAVLFIAMLVPFTLLKDKTGNTLLEFSDLKWPDWSKATEILSTGSSSSSQGVEGTDTIYQWIDADGNKQFSNTEPPEGIDFTAKNYDPNLNVIQSVSTKIAETEKAEVIEKDKKIKEPAPEEISGSPYSVDSIKKLFDDTNNVKKLLDQRVQQQESALGQ